MKEEPDLDNTPGLPQKFRDLDQITQEKRAARQAVIEKLSTLLAESFKRGMDNQGRGGLKGRQRWFSISASLAHSLARLVSELEYEKLRLEMEALKKKVFAANVPGTRFILPPSRYGASRKESSEQQPPGNPD